MEPSWERYREAAAKAVAFQLQFQQPDGSFIWDPSIQDAYHKQPYSWALSSHLGEAHRLINWICCNTLTPTDGLHGYRGDVYKQAWLFQGAHRLGRFDLSYPLWRFLRSCEAPCGGFPHFKGDKYLRALATAWTGISAIYIGDIDLARRVGHCCIRLLEQQPDPYRFYFQLTYEGELVTSERDPNALFIDRQRKDQPYWEASLPWMLLGRLYQATGEALWLDYAERYFALYETFAEDRFTNVGSGKACLAAALHYLNTGEARAREGALAFAEFLVATQYPAGGWRGENEPDELLIYIDHAAEYSVWLRELLAILHAMA